MSFLKLQKKKIKLIMKVTTEVDRIRDACMARIIVSGVSALAGKIEPERSTNSDLID